MLLFKYVGPAAVAKVFSSPDRIAVRFGLPKQYNDPYELFVEPHPPLQSEDERAFYNYFLGRVVEAPVACFSRRPDSVVMWAHYGQEGRGICLGFDEDALADEFPIAYITDIDYRDGPAAIDSYVVSYAYATGKRRHTLRLLEIAHRAAYFTKRLDWQYEHERRLVVPRDTVEDHEGILVARLSPSALRFIVVGSNTDEAASAICAAASQRFGVPLLKFGTGLRTYTPYFLQTRGGAMTWDSDHFAEHSAVCGECGEPGQLLEDDLCQWCAISDEAKNMAPRRSMLTATLHYGIDPGLPFVFDGLKPKGLLVSQGGSPRAPATSPGRNTRTDERPE